METFKVQITFPKGVTRDDIARAALRMGINDHNLPAGSLRHTEVMVDGHLVFMEEWISEDAFYDFRLGVAAPALRAEGIQNPEIEIL